MPPEIAEKLEDFEEGEVRVYDKDSYINSDGELFKFQRHQDVPRAARLDDGL